jgi:outer membrane protein assembly factor BamD (BamD/ComL family)
MKRRCTLLLLVGLAFAACNRNARVAAPGAAAPPPRPLEEAEKLFAGGSYREAAVAYEKYLKENPGGPGGDLALLRLAVTHALPDSPVRNPSLSAAALERLIALYPQSPWRRHAQYLLELEAAARRSSQEIAARDAQVSRLRAELEALKKIDLQRRPSRPPR